MRKAAVAYEYGAETVYMGRVAGQLVFFPVVSYGARRFLCKNFSSPLAMSYDNMASVFILICSFPYYHLYFL